MPPYLANALHRLHRAGELVDDRNRSRPGMILLRCIDTDRFEFQETPDDYLLFLGRFTVSPGAFSPTQSVVSVGSVIYQKGHDVLVRAAAQRGISFRGRDRW